MKETLSYFLLYIFLQTTFAYFAILLNNNNRKPICCMYFNVISKKYIATFDKNKEETKHKIKSLYNLYDFADIFIVTGIAYGKKRLINCILTVFKNICTKIQSIKTFIMNDDIHNESF